MIIRQLNETIYVDTDWGLLPVLEKNQNVIVLDTCPQNEFVSGVGFKVMGLKEYNSGPIWVDSSFLKEISE
jgi:hypothetical protein